MTKKESKKDNFSQVKEGRRRRCVLTAAVTLVSTATEGRRLRMVKKGETRGSKN